MQKEVILKLNSYLEIIKNSNDNDFYLEVKNFIDFILNKDIFRHLIEIIKLEYDNDHKNIKKINLILKKNVEIELKQLLLKYTKNKEISDFIQKSIKKLNSENNYLYIYEDVLEIINKTSKEENKLKKLFSLFYKEEEILLYKQRISIWDAFYELKDLSQIIEFYPVDTDDCLKRVALSMKKSYIKKIIDNQDKLSDFERKKYINYSIKLINFINENLEQTYVNLELLKKIKSKFEWYQKDKLLSLKTKASKTIEKELTYLVCNELFDKGLFPIYKSLFGGIEPDTIDLNSKEPLVMEIKVVKSNSPKTQLKKGFNEIISQINTLNKNVGYYLIFNFNNELLLDIPEKILIGNKLIYFIMIDLHKSPSIHKRKTYSLKEKYFL
ncbi:MAG: hypothetical protein PHN56_01465 [Candidatus Nanoarchaeia archaeon]|nr:hypothetical protein [Candidatus Nanoarchaeia archaeon]